ncbi:MAG: DUF6941 family protein [Candidatus Nealsonbacteria bacterium]
MKILSLLISDRVNIDDNTKKVTIEGIYNSIRALNFPAKHKELIVSVVVQGTPGNHHFRISVIKDHKEIAAVDKEVPTGITHYFIARFANIIFPEQGIYTIKALVDKEELATNINLTLIK